MERQLSPTQEHPEMKSFAYGAVVPTCSATFRGRSNIRAV